MKLTWYGWASFGLEDSAGLRVVTDPYDPETSGFKPFQDAADVVVMSSDNDDFHCNAHLVPKSPGAEVINALEVARGGGARTCHGVSFRAIEAMEHLQHDRHDPDQNAMYRFQLDGLEFGHMGDIGNPLTEAQIDFFDGVDVLFALAGGFPVIEVSEVRRVADAVRPKYVVPMHFRTLCFKLRNSHWITEFLQSFPEEEVDFAFASSVELTAESLPSETRGLVLDHI